VRLFVITKGASINPFVIKTKDMNKEKIRMPTIDMIVEEQKKLLPTITWNQEPDVEEYNSTNIFLDNDPEGGFLIKKLVKKAFTKFDLRELALLKYLFEAITKKEHVITSRMSQKDQQGKECFWIRTRGQYGELNYKAPYFLHLELILETYLYQNYNLDFKVFYNEVIN